MDKASQSSTTSSPNSDIAEEELLEPYTDWIKRVTQEAEDAMLAAGVPDWVSECRRRKWCWCGK
eukprot:8993998-Karenia_brevis.AAC.1